VITSSVRTTPKSVGGERLAIPVFCLIFVLDACCSGDIAAATTIAVKRAKDFIIVAADSRVTGEDGRPRRREQCKITLLDDRSFFASAGVVAARAGSESGVTKFSADQIAKYQYGASPDLKLVADGWAEAMEARFNAQQFLWKQTTVNTMRRFHVEHRLFAQGIFGSGRTIIAAWETQVNYDETPSAITFSRGATREILEEEAGINLWGTNSGRAVVTELLQAGTQKAALWRASVAREAELRGYQRVDRLAFEMKRALDYAIATGVDPAIGGDVATLIVERDRSARWFNKSSACSN
jgi:hypothetical protein